MMRSRIPSLMAAAGAVVVALSGAASASAAAPRARLTPIACHSTLDPSLRRVSIVSVMRPLAHTRTLSVRFSLLESSPGVGAHPVTAGGLGRWLTPADPTLGRRAADVWKLDRSVYGVGAPARYRFQVEFRWLGRGGRVLREVTRSTSSCRERELRPDLALAPVRVRPIPGSARHERYLAVIVNRGLTASGRFSVLFTPGASGAPRSLALPSLAPHARVRVRFTGPLCDATAPPTIVADPADAVDDFDRANNTRTVACPGTPSSLVGATAAH
jgi:hypothetical protein